MKFSKRLGLAGVAVAFVLACLLSGKAKARPGYMKAFVKKYPTVAAAAKKAKCGTCHFGKSKKNRNDYGKALGKHLGKKNQKNPKLIDAALDKAAKEKKKGDTTFGDVIKSGKLPGTNP